MTVTPKTLVVPLDGSAYAERAMPIAEAVAARIGGGLLLVSAQYRGPLEPAEYLEGVAAVRDRCPVDIVTTKETHAAAIIIETLQGADDRVACMTTHGRGRLRWAAVGSVAEDVIRTAARPTLLVGWNARPDFLERSSHLLACDDGGGASEPLASTARAWADLLGLDLHVAIVTHPLDTDSAAHSDVLLRSVATRFGGAGHTAATMIRSRYVAGALADFAEELPAAIVGLNCRARTGLARFALGSVTMGVLHLAPCPLLVTHDQPATVPEDRGASR